MSLPVSPIDLQQLRVLPLSQRQTLTRADDILIDPLRTPAPIEPIALSRIGQCASAILRAREKGASVMLIYGAHLLRNGAALILRDLFARGLITHAATNGAGTIHDWEYAWFGGSTESVEMNVAQGTFGTWDETSRNIHLALMAGAMDGLGYGGALGRFIVEDGANLPSTESLRSAIIADPSHSLTSARADLLHAMESQAIAGGRIEVSHRWKHASILAAAWEHHVPATVHPGIGYDIISNHPIFSGSVIGRAAEWDFKLFGGSVANLDHGVVLSIGSAIMGPQVFEKSLSCVNNLRLHRGTPIISDHSICVVDLQDSGGWDWSQGEPPKSNPAYYLRFCKSYSRMGGSMQYVQCDNVAFIHDLHRKLIS